MKKSDETKAIFHKMISTEKELIENYKLELNKSNDESHLRFLRETIQSHQEQLDWLLNEEPKAVGLIAYAEKRKLLAGFALCILIAISLVYFFSGM